MQQSDPQPGSVHVGDDGCPPLLQQRWVIVVMMTLFGAALLPACSREPNQAQAKTPALREVIPVTMETAASKDMPLQVKGVGTVEAYATVTVKSQVDGEIAQIHIAEGQEVKKGDHLFTLDQRPFQAALSQAEANLARDTAQLRQVEGTLAQGIAAERQARANLARDRALLANAVAQATRYKRLLDEGAIAKEQHDTVQTNAAALEATVQADEAAIENARASIDSVQGTIDSVKAVIRADQAAVENARVQLGYTTIRAPMDGRAGNLLARVGSAAKARDDTAQLVVLNQLHPIYVSFAVPQQTLGDIRKFMASGLAVEAIAPEQGRTGKGKLTFINNTVDTGTGTIQLKATFPNEDQALWPGQFVNVVLTLTVQPARVVVPSRAVQTGQQGQYVFVVKPDMTVESRPVVVARTSDLEAVIETGLTAGERVVTDGQIRLSPGARVEEKAGVPATSGGSPVR